MRRAFRAATLAAFVVACAPAIVRAQDYPNRPVTIVAPAAPGGLYRLFARLFGAKLEQRFGKPFVVENRPGASSVVGTLSVVRAAPDGHTLMVATSSTMATNLTLFKSLPYDPRSDLMPVALIARVPEVLVVNAALPVQSVADIAKLAQATPGGLHFGSAGPGTAQHLGGEMLKAALGVPLTHRSEETRLNSSHTVISYAVFCLKKKKIEERSMNKKKKKKQKKRKKKKI